MAQKATELPRGYTREGVRALEEDAAAPLNPDSTTGYGLPAYVENSIKMHPGGPPWRHEAYMASIKFNGEKQLESLDDDPMFSMDAYDAQTPFQTRGSISSTPVAATPNLGERDISSESGF